MRWSLRRCTPADRAWLWALHELTMREATAALWPWDEVDQRHRFERSLDLAVAQVIVVRSADVGLLWIEDRGLDLFLRRLEIHPSRQGRGLGGAIVADLVGRAHSSSRPLRLRVLRSNPRARALYERCGLRVCDEIDTHWKMSSNG